MDQRAELLRKLMDSKNMKVSDIVKISGLPYSTVKAILERGAEKAGYINVCKICNALGITADELERMVAENNSGTKRYENVPLSLFFHNSTSFLIIPTIQLPSPVPLRRNAQG